VKKALRSQLDMRHFRSGGYVRISQRKSLRSNHLVQTSTYRNFY